MVQLAPRAEDLPQVVVAQQVLLVPVVQQPTSLEARRVPLEVLLGAQALAPTTSSLSSSGVAAQAVTPRARWETMVAWALLSVAAPQVADLPLVLQPLKVATAEMPTP